VALFRESRHETVQRQIGLGSAAVKGKLHWVIGWMPGSDDVWVAREEEEDTRLIGRLK